MLLGRALYRASSSAVRVPPALEPSRFRTPKHQSVQLSSSSLSARVRRSGALIITDRFRTTPMQSTRLSSVARNVHSSSQTTITSTIHASAPWSPWLARYLAAAGVTVLGAAAGVLYFINETKKAMPSSLSDIHENFTLIGCICACEAIYEAATLRDKEAVDKFKGEIAEVAKEDYLLRVAQAVEDKSEEIGGSRSRLDYIGQMTTRRSRLDYIGQMTT